MFFRLLLLLPLFLSADPWGKDADLTYCPRSCPPSPPCPSLVQKTAMAMIEFHQEVISPADGPRSHYIPSSSQYTKQAIQKHGFFKGWILGCDRLMRENNEDWVYKKIVSPDGTLMKSDPVP